MDTLRSGIRVIGSAFMNSEMVYSFLMGMGWFFLLGWAVALVVACASVFRTGPGRAICRNARQAPEQKASLKQRYG